MRLSITRCLMAAAVLCATAPLARAATEIRDDFSRYAEGGDASPGWETGALGWSVRAGALASDGSGRSLATPAAAPYARRMTFEATVRPGAPTGREWKLAGLVVQADDANFWHLAFVEQPDTKGKGHFVELTEMRAGAWQANYGGDTKLTQTASRGTDFAWETGHAYRFRIEVAQDGITGTIAELDGTERARVAYRFDGPAVTSGRPALLTNDLAATFDDVRVDVTQTAAAPPAPTFPPYARKDAGALRGRKTGYFHVERLGGRWWAVDPAGNAYYAVGTDHVNYLAHSCEKLGYAPYSRNVQRKYGSEEKWAAASTDRLKQWSFNTLGAGHSASTRHRGLAHTEFMSFGAEFSNVSDIAPRTTWTGFPNVFHPSFARWCEQGARRRCTAVSKDPWLFGYFIDNELEWFGKNGSATGLVDEAFKKPADHSAKQALYAFLRDRYITIDKFNQAWGSSLASWDALAATTTPILPKTQAGQADRAAFVLLIADRYFAATTAAIRKADPNHMVLGCRFAGYAPPGVIGVAGKYCDIVTVNFYGQVDLEKGISTDMPGVMRRYYAEAKRPLMMTEWSFPALDAGLPSQHGAGQRVATQKEKARCYEIYQKALFSLPFMVGSDYFMYIDEPALGISSTFPEDSNYGLVDVNDDVWPDLTRTAARVNPMAERLHAGDTAELSVSLQPGGPGVATAVLRNAGKRAARFTARLRLNDRVVDRTVALAAGARTAIPLRATVPTLVTVDLDPQGTVVEQDRADNRAEQVVLPAGVARPSIVITNPTDGALENVPVSAPLGSLGPDWTVRGGAAKAQVDALPDGPVLALRLARLPAHSVVVVPLAPGKAARSRVEDGADRAISLPGNLSLSHEAGSGDLFGRVTLGDVPVGRFRAIVHQSGSQSMWVPPDRTERIVAYSGPVRTVLLVTAALGDPGRSDAKTAVNAEGVYAAAARRPNRYRIAFQLTRYGGEDWFGARFLGLENTDTDAWEAVSYYHYPLSAIGGDASDDQPRTAAGSPAWRDEKLGISYGAVVDTSAMRASFWKDTVDGPGEHADIWRELNKTLQPGQKVAATAGDTEVRIFAARDTDKQLGGETLARLAALRRVQVRLTPGR